MDGQFCCFSSVIELAEVQNAGRGKAARLQGYGKGRAGGDIGKSPDSDGVIAHREALRECFEFEWTMVMTDE